MTQNDFVIYLFICSVLCLGMGLGYNLHGMVENSF